LSQIARGDVSHRHSQQRDRHEAHEDHEACELNFLPSIVIFVILRGNLSLSRPSHVEREGLAFGGGRYCPWSAMILRIDEP
jgi:hypothetical protein